jgi:Ca-activated chloride channel family protein
MAAQMTTNAVAVAIALTFAICLVVAALLDETRSRRVGQDVGPLSSPSRLAFWTTIIGMSLLVAALFRPRWSAETIAHGPTAQAIWLCMDVSRSMLAPDAPQNRLEFGKALLTQLLDELQGSKVGVVAVAGEARLVCPPTREHGFARAEIAKLSSDTVPIGGSNWTHAVMMLAQRRLRRLEGRMLDSNELVILVSDGGHSIRDVAPVAAQAREAGLTVWAIGVGGPAVMTAILLPNGEPLVEGGRAVTSRLDERPLRELAQRTGGAFLAATALTNVADAYANLVLPALGRVATERSLQPAEQYRWFIVPAWFIILLGYLPALAGFVRYDRHEFGVRRAQPKNDIAHGVAA